MSKSTHLLGKTSGRIGATVFKIVHGQQIVQEYQPKITNPNSEAQRNQRARFKLMAQLAAVMSPYAVYQREGLTSPRNIFVRENFRNSVSGDGDAAAALLDMQFAKGVLVAPVLDVETGISRGVAMTDVVLDVTNEQNKYDAVVMLVFTRTKDGTVTRHANVMMNNGGNMFVGSYKTTRKETYLYFYGIVFNGQTEKTNYENYIVNNGSEVANLITNNIIGASNSQFSKTSAYVLEGREDETYDIKVYSQNAQMGTVAKSVNQETGEVTLTATPALGNYAFAGWRVSGSQAIVSTDNPYTFIPVKDETFWGMFFDLTPNIED